MDTLYEVMYRRPQRARFCRETTGDLNLGDRVVVSGEREIGKVIWKGLAAEGGDMLESAKVRKASTEDGDRALDLRQKESMAFQVFKEKIDEHDLSMKPVDVVFEADGSRVTFYFTAEHRIDFRQLVRDLAHVYRRRIELRQISPRKEAQMMGGCGACGRELCCACFMDAPQPVSARVAQDQTLSQNLSKLVGVCGQLKCCLRYENGEASGCSGCGHKKGQTEMKIEDAYQDSNA
jgi:cell fate regulator YaaT (PSP1 superfamily)